MIQDLLFIIALLLFVIAVNLFLILKKKTVNTFYFKNEYQNELLEKLQKDVELIKNKRLDIFDTSSFRLFFIKLKKYFQNHADILEDIKDKMK